VALARSPPNGAASSPETNGPKLVTSRTQLYWLAPGSPLRHAVMSLPGSPSGSQPRSRLFLLARLVAMPFLWSRCHCEPEATQSRPGAHPDGDYFASGSQ
jgi:hypothetical protein